MPAAIAVPLIASAVAGGTSLAAAKMGSNANKRATDASVAATDKALAFEKEQYANEQARLQPYRDLGGQAYAKIGKMFGLEAPAGPMMSTGGMSKLVGGTPSPSGTFTFAQPQGGGGMVKIRNPRSGEIRAVPAAQAELLKQRGGQVVG